jgi:ornithine decarboxylase
MDLPVFAAESDVAGDVLTAFSLPPPPRVVVASDTPVLRVELATVEQRYLALSRVLSGIALHYAVKANPAPEVLRTLATMGCQWDVASPGEIDEVLAAGGRAADMSYGNTIKKTADIAYAAGHGVDRFTVDSPGELAKVAARAPGSTVLVRIATSGLGADWALGGKFGCSEDEAATLLIDGHRAGHPMGVAFHVGSQQRDPHAWDVPLAAVARLRNSLRAAGGRLAVVDLGGGFPARTIHCTPDENAYGAAIRTAIDQHLAVDPPEFMAEPGRSLVADAGVLTAEVVLTAERAGERWVYLDIGLFGGLVEAYGESICYRIQVHRDGVVLTGPTGPVILAGPTCDSLDVLYQRHQYQLPIDVRPGDRVQFLSAGAYTASYSSVGFNGFPPLRTEYR